MRASGYGKVMGLALLATSGPSWGCADVDCSPPQTLQLTAEQCGLTGLPFLAADNDTRITLALLTQAQGQSPLQGQDPETRQSRPLSVPFAVSELLSPEPMAPAATDAAPALDTLAQTLGVQPATLAAAHERGNGWLEGRCGLNRPEVAEPFLRALQTSGLPAEQSQPLAEARVALIGLCQSDTLPDFTALPATAEASPFSDYLRGARAFYLGDFADAQSRFTALSQQEQPWLKETATYLLARIAINQAQANALDEYGFFDASKVDKAPLVTAGQALDHYLAAYPQGLYAASAQGLYRRVYWLQDDGVKLAALYQQALQSTKVDEGLPLWNEIDLKLLANKTPATSPLFLLVQDLKRLRLHPEWEESWQPLTTEELNGQQAAFAAAGLSAQWEYLQLAHRYYVAKDYASLVQAIAAPQGSGPLDLLEFSRQMLRGMALQAQQQWPQAEVHWQQLLAAKPDALQQQLLQLALAMTLERADKLDALFAAQSLVTRDELRDPLLRFSASAPLLRQVSADGGLSHELRNTALYTLLVKDLNRGHYADFLQDQALLAQAPDQKPFDLTIFNQGASQEEGYSCPALSETVSQLASTPATSKPAAKALNCLGEFFYRQGWDESPLGSKPGATLLGGAPDRFAGAAHGRLALYQQVIADPKAPAEERSYALFRAINCFASSGYNHCGSEEIPKAERKRWFNTLKQSYGGSVWAKQLKYYW
jgi:hypothetical protein